MPVDFRRYEDEGEGDVLLRPERKKKLKEPGNYAVMLLNDDYTTQEFVVEVLRTIFHKDMEDARRIMLRVHQKGKGQAGVYSYDIAETKVAQVEELALLHEFPLQCTIEEV